MMNTEANRTNFALALAALAVVFSTASLWRRLPAQRKLGVVPEAVQSSGDRDQAYASESSSSASDLEPLVGQPEVVRTPAYSAGGVSRNQELATLRTEVDDLRREVGELREALIAASGPNLSSDPSVLAQELDRLGRQVRASGDKEQRQVLIEQRLKFLGNHPNHEKAEAQLSGLVSEYILAGQSAVGLDKLSAYASRVGMPYEVETKKRATLLLANGQYSEAKDSWKALAIDDSLPEHVQADGAFWAAYSEKRHGHADVAKTEFEDLIARFGHSVDAKTKQLVMSAKAQLE